MKINLTIKTRTLIADHKRRLVHKCRDNILYILFTCSNHNVGSVSPGWVQVICRRYIRKFQNAKTMNVTRLADMVDYKERL